VADRRDRQPLGRLHLGPVSVRHAAYPAHHHHPGAPAGPAGHVGGPHGMNLFRLLLLAAGLAALIVAPIGQGNYIIYTLSSWLLFSISAMGLNLTLGYAGQVSLAQAAFMGIGAYITALLTLAGIHWSVAALMSISTCFVIG